MTKKYKKCITGEKAILTHDRDNKKISLAEWEKKEHGYRADDEFKQSKKNEGNWVSGKKVKEEDRVNLQQREEGCMVKFYKNLPNAHKEKNNLNKKASKSALSEVKNFFSTCYKEKSQLSENEADNTELHIFSSKP